MRNKQQGVSRGVKPVRAKLWYAPATTSTILRFRRDTTSRGAGWGSESDAPVPSCPLYQQKKKK